MSHVWKEQVDKLFSEKISKDTNTISGIITIQQLDTMQLWAKVSSRELRDALVEVSQYQLKLDK